MKSYKKNCKSLLLCNNWQNFHWMNRNK